MSAPRNGHRSRDVRGPGGPERGGLSHRGSRPDRLLHHRRLEHVLGGGRRQIRFFVEVTGTTLDVKVFDPGTSGALDSSAGAVRTLFELFDPAQSQLVGGTPIQSLLLTNDTATTDNCLARFSSTGAFTAANAGAVFAGLSPRVYTLSNDPGAAQVNIVDWRLADWRGGASLGATLPFQPASPLRTYLPNDAAAVPAEPVLLTSTRVVSGTNPPAAGLTTRFQITATVRNPAGSPGALSNVQITVPLVTGAVFVAGSEESTIDGAAAACASSPGATYRRCSFASVAAGQDASFGIQVDYTLPATTAVKSVTGPPAVATPRNLNPVNPIVRVGQTATATFAAAHGYTTGDFITIQGATQPEYNGLFQITVTSATTFTYQVGGAPATPATGAPTATEACPKAADGPVCAQYTPAFSSSGATGFPRGEALGPVCQLVASIPLDLAVTKTAAPASVVAGSGTITYSLTVTNNGPNPIGDVTLDDPLPSGTVFQSLTAPAGWSCSSPPVGGSGTVRCLNGGTMASGASAAFTIAVGVASSVAGGSTIGNTATVSSPGSETAAGNNSATATTPVTAQSNLSVSKTTPTLYTPAGAAASLTYQVTVANAGPSDATSATLTDTLPAGTTFQALSVPSGWSCTTPAVGGTGTVTCNLSAGFPAGAGSTFTLLLSYGGGGAAGGTVVNTTTVASPSDPDASNNSSSATTVLTTAAACATPGRDGNLTVSGTQILNTYYPGTASVAAGATSIALGASRGAATPIAVGDLLLVMQMQDAAIDSTNSGAYGDGLAGDPARGSTSLGNTGRYEYVKATGPVGGVPVGGGTVQVQGLGAGGGLLYAYKSSASTAAQGQRTFQVVRVPQYNNVAYGAGFGTLTAAFWNGSTGGVLALDVAGTLTLSNDSVRSGVGLTIAAGGTVTATFAAHGFASGDLVTIEGATPAAYNGTFPITVTGANTFTYALYRTPGNATPFPTTPATGTITATRHGMNVTGRGFRGGGAQQYTGAAGTATDYRVAATVAPNGVHASKGEGGAGTPRFLLDPSSFTAVVDSGIDGYPNGSNQRRRGRRHRARPGECRGWNRPHLVRRRARHRGRQRRGWWRRRGGQRRRLRPDQRPRGPRDPGPRRDRRRCLADGRRRRGQPPRPGRRRRWRRGAHVACGRLHRPVRRSERHDADLPGRLRLDPRRPGTGHQPVVPAAPGRVLGRPMQPERRGGGRVDLQDGVGEHGEPGQQRELRPPGAELRSTRSRHRVAGAARRRASAERAR